MKRLAISFFILTVLLCGCSVKSADDYYNETSPHGAKSAQIMINCQTAVEYKDSARKNADILKNAQICFNDGDTVFDVLKQACKEYKIQFEYDGADESVYIKGIDYLYEFDCGELSGWEYSVNGEFPGVGCNAYKLSDGDKIEWRYTCNLGEDIGNIYRGDVNE